MAVYKRGGIWWYSFIYAGKRVQESAKTSRKTWPWKRSVGGGGIGARAVGFTH